MAELAQREKGCITHSIARLTAPWEGDPVTPHQAKLLSLAREGENILGIVFDVFQFRCSLLEDYIGSKCRNRRLFLRPFKRVVSSQRRLTETKAFPVKCGEFLPSYHTGLWSFYSISLINY